MADLIIFEQPLNERIRTFLRLEHLFQQIDHFLPQSDPCSSRAAVAQLLDMVSIFGRADLKTELLKELDRHASNLERMRSRPGVDLRTLGKVLDRLEETTALVYALTGQIGHALRENEFLTAIAQRSSIPGGTCAFDLPQFHYWLQQPHAERARQMARWMRDLAPIDDAIRLLLSLTRDSSDPQQLVAHQGFHQQTLDANAPAQLIRVGVPLGARLLAEISGNKHRFTVRFLELAESGRPTQTARDVEFVLNCCVI